ncbi:hypothetical protein [Anianabacter salinae]|uniref:hypothetical protein n=1 Tax=Anianabacter salinae TaxID=2851023 RepID=UPI00225E26F7|nr:hypothetical protein [Anianabacter salinae]MBV0913064.1 hypothetical protein [Anianabacter salinae]
MTRTLAALACLALASPAAADDVTDTLNSAIEAYESGDIQFALEEIAFAQQLMQGMKTDTLSALLPEAPEGFTREIDTEMNAGLAMMGGGTGTEATYSGDAGSFTLTLLADSPMVTAMGAMFSNPTIMAASGELFRVGRQRFVDQDGEVTTLVANRILVQASGADRDVMMPVLEAIDYEALGNFGN